MQAHVLINIDRLIIHVHIDIDSYNQHVHIDIGRVVIHQYVYINIYKIVIHQNVMQTLTVIVHQHVHSHGQICRASTCTQILIKWCQIKVL